MKKTGENMKEKTVKLYRVCALAAIIISVISAVIICMSEQYYDEEIQHYAQGAVLPVIGFALAALAAVPAIIAAAASRATDGARAYITESAESDRVMIYARFLVAAFFAAEFVITLLSFGSSDATLLSAAVALSAILSAVSMLVRALMPKKAKAVAALSVIPIVWSIFSMLNVYFTDTLALNSPHKSMILIAYVYTVFLFITDARFANRRQTVPFFIFSSLVSLSSVSLVIPLLVASVKKSTEGETGIPGLPLISATLLTALCIFAIVRAADISLGHSVQYQPDAETVEAGAADKKEDSENGK